MIEEGTLNGDKIYITPPSFEVEIRLEFSFLIIFEVFNEVGARLSWRLRCRQGMDMFTLTISPSFGT